MSGKYLRSWTWVGIAAAIFWLALIGCGRDDKNGTGPTAHPLVGTWDDFGILRDEWGDSLCEYCDLTWRFGAASWIDSNFEINPGAPDTLDPCRTVAVSVETGTWSTLSDSVLFKTVNTLPRVDTFIYRIAGDTLRVRLPSWSWDLNIPFERR